MSEEFMLLEKVKWLIEYTDKYILLTNFPKVNLTLKIRLESNLYNLLENTIRANINNGKVREKYIKEMLVNLSILDYYIGNIYNRHIIKRNRYNAFVNSISEIRKMSYGWFKSI